MSMKKSLLALLALFATVLTGFAQQSGAKAMFYNPADSETALPQDSGANAGSPLAAIRLVTPFPGHGHVGVHYWFEDGRGNRLSEVRAAGTSEPLSLRLRSNTGGFLSVWSYDGPEGSQLTPMPDRYSGVRVVGGDVYDVPGQVSYSSSGQERRIVIVFSRAQMEQAGTAANALNRLREITARARENGPDILREVDDDTPGSIGTFVVNQYGGPVVAEIVLSRRN